MPASSAIDPGFRSRSGQTKDYKIGMRCFSANHAALRRKSKDWSARNQNNVSEWSDMYTHRLLFHGATLCKSNSACWSSTEWTSSSSHWKLTFSRHNIAEKLLRWRLQSLTQLLPHSQHIFRFILTFVTWYDTRNLRKLTHRTPRIIQNSYCLTC